MNQTAVVQTAADFIRKNSSKLIKSWERVARQKILPARGTSRPILQNHLEELLQGLADALAEMGKFDNPRKVATSNFTKRLSLLHADTRMEAGNYRVHDVLEEYILLRHVVTDAITVSCDATIEIIEIVNRLFELSSLEAVNSFQDSVDQNRQKLILSLAHDLRSPLSIAKMGLGEIINEDLSSSEYEQFLKMVVDSVDRALTMSTEMLDGYTLESGSSMFLNFEKTNLSSVVEGVVTAARLRFQHEIHFAVDEIEQFEGVFATDLLIRVVENLISNSVKYGAAQKAITVSLKTEGADCVISVHNYGKTISSEDQKVIFNLFCTKGNIFDREDNSPRSWGVGLTHLHLAARAHNGEVKLSSSASQGTTFSIYLKPSENIPGGKRVNFEKLSSRSPKS